VARAVTYSFKILDPTDAPKADVSLADKSALLKQKITA
jgi:hypothetical protein